jgi:transposase-like protein
MVKDVREFEAWKVIGFASFEEFCRDKLGKTLVEVEEIVEEVKRSGGGMTLGEVEAKIASRSARAAEMVKAGTHTQAQAARELGVSKQAVNKAISQPKQSNRTKVDPSPTIKLAKDPARTAANIHAKMGAEYCHDPR